VTAPLHAVLFDLDGTLLDTAPDMVGALNALRAEQGHGALPFAQVRSFVSHGSARLVKLGFPAADAQSFALLQQRFLQLYGDAVSRETRLFDGMEEVLAALDSSGLKCGIVTNKPARFTTALLAALHLTPRFACVVCGDTVSERKPHAMPMLHAARLAGVAADSCVYVGDAARDIEAAHAAGMPGLVATYGYLEPDEDWRAWGGDGSITKPLDLLDWLERRGHA
jgi:phosphoglycolate phosphatase